MATPTFLDGADRGQVCLIATGQYTGDGTRSQAITGVGFQPKYIFIHERLTEMGNANPAYATDQDPAGLAGTIGAGFMAWGYPDWIDSIDPDGFTVDDGGTDRDPNMLDQVYVYVCLG